MVGISDTRRPPLLLLVYQRAFAFAEIISEKKTKTNWTSLKYCYYQQSKKRKKKNKLDFIDSQRTKRKTLFWTQSVSLSSLSKLGRWRRLHRQYFRPKMPQSPSTSSNSLLIQELGEGGHIHGQEYNNNVSVPNKLVYGYMNPHSLECCSKNYICRECRGWHQWHFLYRHFETKYFVYNNNHN